ncbi:hypothetical protein D0T49_08245 [Paludibacter sp. 221]|uniref:4-alpha-glucanotransferase n=1 Tax=Paludibacter sp. 221 TaxID=2302939 RepID=UPI0013D4D849|nr:4-alpha-glucanotransferase [Paludibacter sp. 221]NDV47037.1 hypothetical protein [Paludibacter sp. 221]
MIIKFEIDYRSDYGQVVCVSGNLPELGGGDVSKALMLSQTDDSHWSAVINVENAGVVEYNYLIKEGSRVVRTEWGDRRNVRLDAGRNFIFTDSWHDAPHQKYFYTSAFYNSFFHQKYSSKTVKYFKQSILLTLSCPCVGEGQEIILTGESDLLGNWNIQQALIFQPVSYSKYRIVLNAEKYNTPLQYKFAIRDKKTKNIIHWEEGENRVLHPVNFGQGNQVQAYDLSYRRNRVNWKASGVVIPVFSLRSKKSFGVGEFSDLEMMIDWAKTTGMKVIQILPINDTTVTRQWTDSYPYNAISIYALHPIYLGLNDYPLKDDVKLKAYKKRAAKLNALPVLDYEQVMALKEEYIRDLFGEKRRSVLNSEEFAAFYSQNEEWLFPYACFTYFRDKYQTADHATWQQFRRYNKKKLQKLAKEDARMNKSLELVYFTQFLLHSQLIKAKEYAHKNGVVLKGDIPIGINRNSVDAWAEPQLFNLDTQTGAPPDDFSIFGQNWGFPTYNWDEMAKDGYQWWRKRFRKMADYFDAYRIDHILGFFRIWEIPEDSVQGLLGYFNPALPFTVEEIENGGLRFDEYRMTKPYITDMLLEKVFANDKQEVVDKFLNLISFEQYELKEFCNTQRKIERFFEGKNDEKEHRIQNGLYQLCNEVLFVRDKYQPAKYHPRITAQCTNSYQLLNDEEKYAFNRLYDHFFYERHNEFWSHQAMRKLPPLISSTDMLVCGEDLGMIPACVPQVMDELQILSLEIERMPKQLNTQFENLNIIPYLSVCTTSTHDMSPIRAWWLENRDVTQQYYNTVLGKEGVAPESCTPELCKQILMNHLRSNAMLAIIPLQDWLSMSDELRRKDPYEERINIPAVPKHYWQYRMHLTLEDLLKAGDFNREVSQMVGVSSE